MPLTRVVVLSIPCRGPYNHDPTVTYVVLELGVHGLRADIFLSNRGSAI